MVVRKEVQVETQKRRRASMGGSRVRALQAEGTVKVLRQERLGLCRSQEKNHMAKGG